MMSRDVYGAFEWAVPVDIKVEVYIEEGIKVYHVVIEISDGDYRLEVVRLMCRRHWLTKLSKLAQTGI